MKKAFNLAKNLGLTGLFFSYLPSKALAQAGNLEDMKAKMGNIAIYAESSSKSQDVEGRIYALINYAVGFLGLVAVVFLIIGGVQYMTAAGDEGKVEKATKTITNALIGLAIVILSGLIVNFVLSKILGV